MSRALALFGVLGMTVTAIGGAVVVAQGLAALAQGWG